MPAVGLHSNAQSVLEMDTLTKWVAGTQYEYDLRNHWDTATVVTVALSYRLSKGTVLLGPCGCGALRVHFPATAFSTMWIKLISSNADLIEVSDELVPSAESSQRCLRFHRWLPHAYAIYPHVGWAGDDAVAPKQTLGSH